MNTPKVRRPKHRGVHIHIPDLNHFEGDISKEAREELNLNLEMAIIGEEALQQKELASKAPPAIKSLKNISSEVTYLKKRKRFLSRLNLKPNALRFATNEKKYLLYFLIVASMLSEFIIYKSVAEIAFGVQEPSSIFIGLVAPLFTKFVAFAFARFIKDWNKEFNIFRKNLRVSIGLSIVALILLNAGAIAFSNHHNNMRLEKAQKAEELITLIDSIEKSQSGEDTQALELELQKLMDQSTKPDGPLTALMKVLAICLISILIILTGAILFVVAELYGDALGLKQKKAHLRQQLKIALANYNQYNKSYSSLLSQRREIVRMHAQMDFLERKTTPLFQK